MTGPRVGIVGAGPGGLAMGMRLRAADLTNFTIFEAADGVGGTWRHNRYPGAACDTKTHFYSFSFAPNPRWGRHYAEQPEILAYLEDCATRFGLRPHLRLSTPVVAARWLDDDRQWELRVAHGGREQVERFDVVVSAVGMLNVPKLPDIVGRGDFAGTAFHSARWDPDLDVTGRDVAVIGSGASAVQLVPRVAERARTLYLFQRSPGWVIPKTDGEFTEEQRSRFERSALARKLERARIFWKAPTTIGFGRLLKGTTPLRQASLDHYAAQVRDPATRAALTPDYPFGCKRLLISSDYLPTFNRDNVELVTTPIDRITADGVRTADGVERAVDTVVYATGFDAVDYLSTIDVTGRDGTRLHDVWKDGAYAYLGMTVPGFPNLFLLYGPNTNQGSIIFMIESQVRHIVGLVRGIAAGRFRAVEPRPRRTAAYNRRVERRFRDAVWHSCTNYYTTATGKIPTQYPFSSLRYWLATRVTGSRSYALTRRGDGS